MATRSLNKYDLLTGESAEGETRVMPEITPEMIKAGLDSLHGSGILLSGSSDDDGKVVSEIYRAMRAASPQGTESRYLHPDGTWLLYPPTE